MQKLILIFYSLLIFQITYADTDVGGIINSDQTWTLSNSPYNLTSTIQLDIGVSLLIEPGVVVNGNGKDIEIWGSLIAIGDENNDITFNNTNVKSGSNNYSDFFYLELVYCKFNSGSLLKNGSMYGSFIIRHSEFYNLKSKIYVWYPSSESIIDYNVFNNCGRIYYGVTTGSNDPPKYLYIRNNLFTHSMPVANAKEGYAIENFAKYRNGIAIIENNSFFSTDKVAVSLDVGYNDASFNAPNNYWGTTDESTIQSMIYDRNDDLNCNDYIQYQPFLTEPHQNTPLLSINNYENIPVKFVIEQNYPNPFNPNTTITYGLNKDSNVSVKIYDISGKLITTLQNEYQTQGEHSIRWDGTDDFGNKLGAGVYLYQVKAGDFVQTKKMVFVK